MSSPSPSVIINDASNCYVDGMNYGAPIDAIANNPQLAPAIQTALVAWMAQVAQVASAFVALQQENEQLKARIEELTPTQEAPAPSAE